MPDKIASAPRGAGGPGRALWRAVLQDFELDEHEMVLLREAVRTVDLLADLDMRIRADGSMIDSPQGPRVHPAAVEARQQRIVLARLIVALRVPLGDQEEQSSRAQYRGPRGVYAIHGGAS